MIAIDLQGTANAVIRRAQRQGSIVPREIREELALAGADPTLWKDVLALARASLSYRRGRYYYVAPVSQRIRQEQEQQEAVHDAVRQLIRQHKADASQVERREQGRLEFVQPVKVITADGREFTLMSRDLSPNGIRLVGTRSLLGQKVLVQVPRGDGQPAFCFLVRILWTGAVGDELFENGGMFLDVFATDPEMGEEASFAG